MTLKPAALPHPLQSESYSPPTSPFLAKGNPSIRVEYSIAWRLFRSKSFQGSQKEAGGGIKTK